MSPMQTVAQYSSIRHYACNPKAIVTIFPNLQVLLSIDSVAAEISVEDD